MKIHELKTDPDVFGASITGAKTFEIRFNDRSFMVDDLLLLRETEYSGEEMNPVQDSPPWKEVRPLKYTGRTLLVKVTDIMSGPIYGLERGWVIMSVKPVRLVPAEPGDS